MCNEPVLVGWLLSIDYRPSGHPLTPDYSPPIGYTGRAEQREFTTFKRFLAGSWSEKLFLVEPARLIAVRKVRG